MTEDHPKKLFLLDAYALIYRAYFAFANNPRINSKGLNTSAVFGFTNTLLEVLKKEKPTHMAVVFDLSAPTVRHVEFEAYKANREEMPEDLRTCIPYIFKLLEGFRITTLSLEGYEADDLIGTLARKAEQEGYLTYIITPDKDYGQLVDENTFIYKPARLGNGAEILGVEEICKKWEITHVGQLIDILGLMGDKVDNIPGIPGVGEKTAIQLMKDFGTIENLLENTDKLKGKLKEKVEANKELALLSKKLATIILDVPVELVEEDLRMKELDKDVLRDLFAELEFRRMAEILLGESLPVEEKPAAANQKSKPKDLNQIDMFSLESEIGETSEQEPEKKIFQTAADIEHHYICVDSEEKMAQLTEQLKSNAEFCFDTETTSLDTISAEIVGMSFAVEAHKAWYLPFPADQTEAQQIVEKFRWLFEDESKTLIAQNIKYDMQVLKNYNIEIKNKIFDTMVAHFLLNADMRHNMNVLAETYLNYSPISIETLIGKKGKGQTSMRDADIAAITEYAAEDADITLQLKEIFAPQLKSTETEKLFEEIEVPLIKVLGEMEREGVNLDIQNLRDYSLELEKDIIAVDKEIQALAGTPFNTSSPKQVGEVLFEYLKIIDKPKKTKTGQYSTGEDVLSKLVNKHPIVNKILDYRELVKLKNTYVDTLPELVNKRTGRIHTSYNQVVAVTGRLSSDNPNLQNIPIRTTRGREIRKAFIPRSSDYILLSADYSQIELRIVAALSQDPNMCEAFKLGKDIHTATAAKVYGIAEEEVTKEMRYKAKSVNFGIIYGQGAFGLAENLNISRGEAKELIDNYFREYGSIKKYMDEQVNLARENGFVKTVMGRKRYLRDITSANAVVRGYAERNAINAPIQGSAADMIKIAMINIQKDLRPLNLRSKMILQVHDELVFDIHKDELSIIQPIIENRMKTAMDLGIPLEVGIGMGDNWLAAH
ncbi:MAG: DNA polymerase I [Bacteroidetes bacterium]|nr:DNA polymerase I [Bacteroidota bacterium]